MWNFQQTENNKIRTYNFIDHNLAVVMRISLELHLLYDSIIKHKNGMPANMYRYNSAR